MSAESDDVSDVSNSDVEEVNVVDDSTGESRSVLDESVVPLVSSSSLSDDEDDDKFSALQNHNQKSLIISD